MLKEQIQFLNKKNEFGILKKNWMDKQNNPLNVLEEKLKDLEIPNDIITQDELQII